MQKREWNFLYDGLQKRVVFLKNDLGYPPYIRKQKKKIILLISVITA